MNKTTTIILIIIILGVAVGGYFLFFRQGGGLITPSRPGAGGTLPSGGGTEIPGKPQAGEDEFGSGGEPVGSGEGAGTAGGVAKPVLQIIDSSVSGMGVGTSTIRYVEKSTGHIYEIDFDGKNRRRISNKTILRTFDSYWSPKADKLIVRYFEEGRTYPLLNTFLAVIPEGATTTMAIEGIFLPQSAKEVAVSPSEDKIFYFNVGSVSSIGIIAGYKNDNKKTAMTLPFSEFNVAWPGQNFITLLTKPSYSTEGFLYVFDIKKGKLDKALDKIMGLTANLSPNGEKIIYSAGQKGGGIETNVFVRKDKKSIPFGLRTFPEKCVWSKIDADVVYCSVPNNFPVGNYPDDWYQGLVSFSDSVWKMDILMGKSELLVSNTEADAMNLLLDRQENNLFFTDKKNGNVRVVRLK